MNKNVSVWRGSNTPPTNNHVWVKNDNQIYLHNGDNWENVASKELQWSVLLIDSNGHSYVDLGLPSGTLWATTDVGGNGAYFSWGIHSPTSSWMEQQQPYDFEDAASYNMGGDWVLPNKAQFEELFEYTTASEPQYNGYGNEIIFTSTINGNSIKFNLYGYGSGSSVQERGSVGKYWTSSEYNQWGAYLANISNSTHSIQSESKYKGCKIRGVISQ